VLWGSVVNIVKLTVQCRSGAVVVRSVFVTVCLFFNDVTTRLYLIIVWFVVPMSVVDLACRRVRRIFQSA